jgi:hypothetical protein
MPLVLDSPHEQGTIELHGTRREQGPVLKKARCHFFDGQGLHPPTEAPQFQAVELTGLGRNRIPQRPALEEVGRFLERPEKGGRRKFLGDVALDQQMGVPVVAVQFDPVTALVLLNLEGSMVMDAWKQPTTQERIESRRSVSAWDEDALAGLAVLIPLDGDPVRSVFGRETAKRWQPSGPDVLEPDQADSSHACAVDQLGPERGRENPTQNLGVHPEIDENSAVDDASDDRDLHNYLLERLTANQGGG